MRYPSSRNLLSFLGRLLRRVLAWRRPALVPVPVRRDRRGLTIVEMLVTLAITLIMMGAVVNLFANIGESVNDSRAAIEMSSMLRSARQLLQQDLAGATCPTLPWTHVDAGLGYFEIIEGPATDRRPSVLTDGETADPELEAGTSKVPANTSLVPRAALASQDDVPLDYLPINHDYNGNTPNIDTLLTGFGDFDDVLALTVRSNDVPFVGRVGGTTIESNLAEVIWFAVENPADGSRGEPGMRTVYRRVLLIVPAAVLPKVDANVLEPDPSSPILNANHPERFRVFFRNYDISARLEGDQWVANSLSDLTKREYRFAHRYNPADADLGFPHPMDVMNLRIGPRTSMSPLHPFGGAFEFATPVLAGIAQPFPGSNLDRNGEDIVLTDVLAFDVLVYDPLARLRSAGTGPNPPVLKPGDPAWNLPHPTKTVGLGAYVDLGFRASSERWSGKFPPSNQTSHFSPEMAPSSQISDDVPSDGASRRPVNLLVHAVYDTWSDHYEVDGKNQDRTGDPEVDANLQDDLIDEGTDAIDNPPMQFGVDDIAERETSPPYPVPLRAVEVRLRTYERDSRQVREVSVRQSFVPQ